jgi:hypothetical protein
VRRIFGSLFVAMVLFARGASAGEGELALRYEPTEGCPSRAEFEALVLARTRHVRFTDGASRRSLVTLAHAKRGFVGSLTLEGAPGRAMREIEAPTCPQLADAMSLVVALAVDPEALLTPEAPATPPAPPASPAPPAPPASVPEPIPEPSAVLSAPSPEPAPILPPPVSRHGFSLGAAVALETDIAPDPVMGVALRAEYEVASSSWVAPSFGVELAGAASNLIEAAPAVAVRFATVRLDACPARALLGATGVTLRACGAAALGVLDARGVGAPKPEDALRGWVDAEIELRARWDARRWFLGIDGGPVLPVTRPKFVFELPYQFVYEVPQVCVRTELFAGVRF